MMSAPRNTVCAFKLDEGRTSQGQSLTVGGKMEDPLKNDFFSTQCWTFSPKTGEEPPSSRRVWATIHLLTSCPRTLLPRAAPKETPFHAPTAQNSVEFVAKSPIDPARERGSPTNLLRVHPPPPSLVVLVCGILSYTRMVLYVVKYGSYPGLGNRPLLTSCPHPPSEGPPERKNSAHPSPDSSKFGGIRRRESNLLRVNEDPIACTHAPLPPPSLVVNSIRDS